MLADTWSQYKSQVRNGALEIVSTSVRWITLQAHVELLYNRTLDYFTTIRWSTLQAFADVLCKRTLKYSASVR